MKDIKVKVAVIGAGTAGISAFREAVKVDRNCVLINGGLHGTTCARVGCMPSKILIQVANDFHRRLFFEKQGIKNSDRLILDKGEAMKYIRSLRDYFVNGVLESVKKMGDKYIEGHARFIEPTVLDVEGIRIRAEAIVIASGSSPVVPDKWRAFGDRILTTNDIFEQETLSDPMAVIGSGAIGLELGMALSRMGIGITMIEGGHHIGGLTDPVVNQYAVETIREELDLVLDQKADLFLNGHGLELSCQAFKCTIEKALVAIGRKPNIRGLELEKVGVPLNEKGLPEVDPNTLKIHNIPVFVAGDANGYRAILHEASDEGRIAGYNAVRPDLRCFKRRTPLAITFMAPNIVIAGKHYREIEKEPHLIGETTFENQGRSRIKHKNRGIIRIYAEPGCGRLLGAEMIAPEGEYIGHLLAWAIQKEMTVFELVNMPFYHPTVLEGLRTAVRSLVSKVKGPVPTFDLAPCETLTGECFN